MDIQKTTTPAGAALKLTGRLDAQWSDHLGRALDEVVRQGMHEISLDTSDIDYLSSAGIRVLLIYYKRLKEIGGSLVVINPSKQVQSLLVMSGLKGLLTASPPHPQAAMEGGKITAGEAESLTGASGRYETTLLDGARMLTATAIGHPDLLLSGIAREECRVCPFPPDCFGLGLGALGDGDDYCRDRLGEFLSVGGMTACLPAGGTTPDYLIGASDFIPEVRMAYGIAAEGGFSHLIRFEAQAEAGRIGLGEIIETCLNAVGAQAAGLVMVGENAGLVGASLRLSPVAAVGTAFFDHPAVRNRLTFTTERAYTDHVSVVAGFAIRGSSSVLDPFLRPLGQKQAARGHFHAAVFSYRPLPKGLREPTPVISRLFKKERLQGVLHLLTDERDITGVGESEFIRGACWVSALTDVTEGDRS